MVKVAYIAGCARSGSTLLTRLLGELPGFVPVGQAASYYLLGRGRKSDQKDLIACGCGASMKECPLWSQVGVDPDLSIAVGALIRGRFLHRALFWREKNHEDLRRYLVSVSEFYHRAAALTGASVIVDSSKNPVFAACSARAPEVRVHVVHLVRDLQGVVGSWLRPKAYLAAQSPQSTIRGWYLFNLESELIQHKVTSYSRVRYEDLVAAPKRHIEQLGGKICEGPVGCNFIQDRVAHLRPRHLVGGNPDKWKHGDVVVSEPPCAELSPWLRAGVSIAGAPLLLRYGYFFRRPAHAVESRAPSGVDPAKIDFQAPDKA